MNVELDSYLIVFMSSFLSACETADDYLVTKQPDD